MMLPPAIVLPAGGLLIGIAMGYAARRSRFCTLGALERHWYGNDATGVRSWALAIATAIAATQILIHSGVIDISGSFYLAARLSLLGACIGGLIFGLGMALVGTCGFGALIRLGGGNLQGLVVVLIIGIVGLATQSGLIALARVNYVESLALSLAPAADQSLGGLANALFGIDIDVALAIAIPAAIIAWVFSEPGYRKAALQIRSGVAIGLLIAAGWLVTASVEANWIGLHPVQIESASFVAPYGDVLRGIISYPGDMLPDYGMGLVFGVTIGAAIAARRQSELRWEACDDARELKRHMAGAVLMGIGGILATGCTIGQGISAASTLAISAPLVLASIVCGARLGLAWLIEGSVRHVWT